MRILMYGAGVIGSIFAGKLAQAGNEVTVLARSTRYRQIKEQGIVLVQPKSRKIEQVSVAVIDVLRPDDRYDYLIVTMQRTQVDAILPVLSRNNSPNIVFVVNTAGGYESWAQAVGPQRLMIGFPAAGGERKNATVSYFIAKGMQRIFQTTTFGEYSQTKTKRVKILIKLFCRAGIPSVWSKHMDAWQKTHVGLVTNIANALYGFDCDNVALGHSRSDVRRMVDGIQESRKVLRSVGITPRPRKLIWMDLSPGVLTFLFRIFMRTELAQTTMAKHCSVAKPEMQYLQQEFDVLLSESHLETVAITCLKRNLS
ncbi:MAG: ketopantoate reductase family protein [Sphaerochaeta sp.]|uniref:ketopantoate reductase family protein n=1 Tax=Sphaerochaeta sp. TaxID=1972642 RepID=UPI003D0A1525